MTTRAGFGQPINLFIALSLKQIGRLPIALTVVAMPENTANWIEPNGLPPLFVVLVSLGFAVIAYRPKDCVVLIRELFESIGHW